MNHDTWTLTKQLRATELYFWRRSARISRRQKIRNTVIRDEVEAKKLQWKTEEKFWLYTVTVYEKDVKVGY